MKNAPPVAARKIKLIPKLIHFFFNTKMRLISLLGGDIVGARALIIKDQQVLLIQHTYSDLGWLTVGGGVNSNESALEAICREVEEETSLKVHGKPRLFGVYYTNYNKRDDHIIFYIIENFSSITRPRSPEIETMQWFDIHNLPENISPATKRRIAEYLGQQEISDRW
jgi:8-oxo-dGTP pyrophosphatase MutT (NUDIX family)